MTIFRGNLGLICLVGAVIATGVILTVISQRVYDTQKQVRQKERELLSEQWEIRALKAEWAYLTRPDRLDALARAASQTRVGDVAATPVMQNLAIEPVVFSAPTPPAKPFYHGRSPVHPVSSDTPSPVKQEKQETKIDFSDVLNKIGGGR